MTKQNRNDLCSCGSGLKYKKCCKRNKSNSDDFFSTNTNSALFNGQFGDIDLPDIGYAADLINELMDQPLDEVEKNHRKLIQELKKYNPVACAIAFSNLLMIPELHGNCFRLEVLTALSLAFGNGKKVPNLRNLQEWFLSLKDSLYGLYEDPAEDVFLSLVSTSSGNYRLFEGIKEGNAFYLQRMINIVEGMPKHSHFAFIRSKVKGLLNLSEEMARRLGIKRYELGELFPKDRIPSSVYNSFKKVQELNNFNGEDLERIGIDIEDLEPFFFDITNLDRLRKGNSIRIGLDEKPIVFQNNSVVLLRPTAIGIAIRHFIFETLASEKLLRELDRSLVGEYKSLLTDYPIFGDLRNLPIKFSKGTDVHFSSIIADVDEGRFMHFIFLIPSIESAASQNNGFSNKITFIDGVDIEEMVSQAYISMSKQKNFKSGLSLIVGCDWGQGLSTKRIERNFPNWHIDYVGVSDILTLSLHGKFEPLTAFRIYDAINNLKEKNIQVMNVNGLVNLFAHFENNNGNILFEELPEGIGAADQTHFLAIDQSQLREVRHSAFLKQDIHRAPDQDRQLMRVRRDPVTIFKDDQQRPLYISDLELSARRLRAVYETDERYWWVEAFHPTESSMSPTRVDQFRMLHVWLSRAVPIVEEHIKPIPTGVINWNVFLHEISQDIPDVALTKKDLLELAHISVNKNTNTINLTLDLDFSKGFNNIDNIAEKVIVERFILGVLILSGDETGEKNIERLSNLVIPNPAARHMHGFVLSSFRDFLGNKLSGGPITINPIDHAMLRLGLCWDFSERGTTSTIQGKEQCASYLKNLIGKMEDTICLDLSKYSREALVRKMLMNHEQAAHDKALWRRTSKAMLALHDDEIETFNKISNHDRDLNACLMTSRVIIEMAICESPNNEGIVPGKLDISRLMALVMCLVQLGEWLNLINADYIEPILRITPTGEIKANLSFIDDIVDPYSALGTEKQIADAIESYDDLFSIPEIHASVNENFHQDFLEAWQEEFAFNPDEARKFIDLLEEISLGENEVVLQISRSNLLNRPEIKEISQAAANIVDNLGSFPRAKWHTIPSGYLEKDRHPWRFGRRLSLLRRPIVHISDEIDSILLIAPGLLREAFIYSLSHYHNGDFQHDLANTSKMKKWFGQIADHEGAKFNKQVEEKMRELGWQVKSGVNITEIFGFSHETNYGDIDVLAWDNLTGRILLIECKNLKFSKTSREIADQLYKYRGIEYKAGKRDDLKKHLDRVDLLQRHSEVLVKYLKLSDPIIVEGHIVFSKIVPMLFAWERIKDMVTLTIFDDLESFRIFEK